MESFNASGASSQSVINSPESELLGRSIATKLEQVGDQYILSPDVSISNSTATYLWEKSSEASTGYSSLGVTTPTLVLNNLPDLQGMYVRVRISFISGNRNFQINTVPIQISISSVTPSVTLAVQGAPNLPLNGTSTLVTVGFAVGTPTRVELSRDGFAPFAIWPTGTFFSLATDGKSLTGNWCISASCWGNVGGAHVLNVVATYANGAVARASVNLNVADVVNPPPMPPPTSVQYIGVTSAMWSEISNQRNLFGDPNNCQTRVNSIPTSGGVTLQAGADISAALSSNAIVFLNGGTYRTARRIVVPRGKKLIGVPGQSVTIVFTADDYGMIVQNGSVLVNVMVDSSGGDGITFYDDPSGSGSTDTLIHRVSIQRSGYFNLSGDNSSGARLTQNAHNNCLVSVEAKSTWNELGGSNQQGGNADGINNSFGAYNNTFIDVHAYNNGDDGFDMWEGGQSYWYFSASHDNGVVPGKTSLGNGNGIKLGTGNVVHKFYKTTANNNRECGYDRNGNLQDALLVQSTASGNPRGNYCYFLTPVN